MTTAGLSTAVPRRLVLLLLAAALTGCCTSTLQRGCDPMPKWRGYALEAK